MQFNIGLLPRSRALSFINFNGRNADTTFQRASGVKFLMWVFISRVSFELAGLPETSVLSQVTVTSVNRYVQFYGFNHEYQQPNVNFVET